MYDEEKKPSAAKKIFKAIAYALIAAVYLTLFIRFFVSCDSAVMKQIIKTDATEEIYREKGDVDIRQYEIRNWYKSIDDGKISSLDNLYYFPETKNLQVSVKFNKKILADPDRTYSSENLPFAFYLEDETLKTYSDYTAVYDERYSFGYIRLNFSGVSLEIDGETDENGEQAVHNFELYIQKKNADETVSDFESFSLYTGSRAYRKVYYK